MLTWHHQRLAACDRCRAGALRVGALNKDLQTGHCTRPSAYLGFPRLPACSGGK